MDLNKRTATKFKAKPRLLQESYRLLFDLAIGMMK